MMCADELARMRAADNRERLLRSVLFDLRPFFEKAKRDGSVWGDIGLMRIDQAIDATNWRPSTAPDAPESRSRDVTREGTQK